MPALCRIAFLFSLLPLVLLFVSESALACTCPVPPFDCGSVSPGTQCCIQDGCTCRATCSQPNCDEGVCWISNTNPCTYSMCNSSDECEEIHDDYHDGDPCEDGDPCTAGDSCSGGYCVPGANTCGCSDYLTNLMFQNAAWSSVTTGAEEGCCDQESDCVDLSSTCQDYATTLLSGTTAYVCHSDSVWYPCTSAKCGQQKAGKYCARIGAGTGDDAWGWVDSLSGEVCADGFDNDCDGLVDCADGDCSKDANPTCCTGNPPIWLSSWYGDASSSRQYCCENIASEYYLFKTQKSARASGAGWQPATTDTSANYQVCCDQSTDCSHYRTCVSSGSTLASYPDWLCHGADNTLYECAATTVCQGPLSGKQCYQTGASTYIWLPTASSETGNCADGFDNDCDGKWDWDTWDRGPAGNVPTHGDDNCGIGIQSCSAPTSTPGVGETVRVSCAVNPPASAGTVQPNSVTVTVTGGSCSWVGWSGNDAQFDCVFSTEGAQSVTCTVDSTISYQAGIDKACSFTIPPSGCTGPMPTRECNDPGCGTEGSICVGGSWQWSGVCQGNTGAHRTIDCTATNGCDGTCEQYCESDGYFNTDNGGCTTSCVMTGYYCDSDCDLDLECVAAPCDPCPGCGDGSLIPPETCDDWNIVGGDGCSASCQLECGDGLRDTDGSDGYSEECDDGNTVSGDGCDSTCHLEGTPPAIICSSHADCDDTNPCTVDVCLDPGLPSSSCTHSALPNDCGGWTCGSSPSGCHSCGSCSGDSVCIGGSCCVRAYSNACDTTADNCDGATRLVAPPRNGCDLSSDIACGIEHDMTNARCFDAPVDNDCDGSVDLADPDCRILIQGDVTNLSGSSLEGAQVFVVTPPAGFATESGSDGRYSLLDVPVGDRVMGVSLPGYRAQTRPVTLTVPGPQEEDFVLSDGDCDQCADWELRCTQACSNVGQCGVTVPPVCEGARPGDWVLDAATSTYVRCCLGAAKPVLGAYSVGGAMSDVVPFSRVAFYPTLRATLKVYSWS